MRAQRWTAATPWRSRALLRQSAAPRTVPPPATRRRWAVAHWTPAHRPPSCASWQSSAVPLVARLLPATPCSPPCLTCRARRARVTPFSLTWRAARRRRWRPTGRPPWSSRCPRPSPPCTSALRRRRPTARRPPSSMPSASASCARGPPARCRPPPWRTCATAWVCRTAARRATPCRAALRSSPRACTASTAARVPPSGCWRTPPSRRASALPLPPPTARATSASRCRRTARRRLARGIARTRVRVARWTAGHLARRAWCRPAWRRCTTTRRTTTCGASWRRRSGRSRRTRRRWSRR